MKFKKELILAILLGAIFPVWALRFTKTQRNLPADSFDIIVLTEGGTISMNMQEYLTGVLLCEMPSDFEVEALKAQAVAARTFVLYRKENGSKHPDADICTSASCCQGYLTPESYILAGGNTMTVLRMHDAVCATGEEVLLYDGSIIEATYFSSSGGRTEDAQAVWGSAVPYLKSVNSDEQDTTYTSEMDKRDFCTALGLQAGEVHIDEPKYTQGGGIAEVNINGEDFTGLELRRRLRLRSTQISFYVGKEKVQIVTNGYGHRVGMSQYGADAMAVAGNDYRQILTHYYSGVTIGDWKSYNN